MTNPLSRCGEPDLRESSDPSISNGQVTTPIRPIESYVHGLSGPLGLIEGPEAVALLRYCDLGQYLREHRGVNPHLDRAIGKLRLVSAAYRGTNGGTSRAEPQEPAQLSDRRLNTQQAAALFGVTPRAITKAINEGRLAAEWFAGRWVIDLDHVRTQTNGCTFTRRLRRE